MPCVRPKSCPVPFGEHRDLGSVPATPFTTSFIVPSPPTTTSSRPVAGDAPRELGQVARALREELVALEPELGRARAASFGQRFAVAPFALAG